MSYSNFEGLCDLHTSGHDEIPFLARVHSNTRDNLFGFLKSFLVQNTGTFPTLSVAQKQQTFFYLYIPGLFP